MAKVQETGAKRLQQINLDVDNDAALIFQHHLVDKGMPLTIRSGANEITWGYSLLTKIIPTYGGEVQQILGTRIEEMTINGNTRDNNQLEQIYDWFRAYMTMASGFGFHNADLTRSEVPITFTYPARKWQFEIQVTNAEGFAIGTGLVATPWQIKAIIVPNGENRPHILEKFTHDKMTDVLLPKGGIPIGIGYIVQNPYSDANYGGADITELSHTIGDNWHRQLGAWTIGDFSHFVGDHSLPPAYNGLNIEAKEYYIKAYGSEFVAQSAQGSGLDPLNTDGLGAASGTSGSSSAVSANQNKFSNRLAALTKWDFGFICTWCLREEGRKDKVPAVGNRHVPDGDYNFLNVGQNDSGPTAEGASANFLPDPVTAANFTFDWIQHHSAPAIRAMLTSLPGKTAEECIVVLAASGWATSDTYLSGLLDIYRNQVKPGLQIQGTTGSGGAPSTTGFTKGYVNPLHQVKNVGPSRVDGGVDYTGEGNFVALGNGKITYASTTSGWPGHGFINLQLSDGVYAGYTIFYAENITPSCKVGDVVKAGDVIGYMHNSSPHVEFGFAISPSEDLQYNHHLYKTLTDGTGMAAAYVFNELMHALGAPLGTDSPGCRKPGRGTFSGPVGPGPGEES